MTIEEAKTFLNNTKVYVSDKTKLIQEKLFEIGYRWESHGKTISNIDAPFLYIDANTNYISYGNKMDLFLQNDEKEVSAKEILSIEINKESPKYKPFDKVLVKIGPLAWEGAFYASEDSTYYHFISDKNILKSICTVLPYNDKTKYLLGTNIKENNVMKETI